MCSCTLSLSARHTWSYGSGVKTGWIVNIQEVFVSLKLNNNLHILSLKHSENIFKVC